MNIIFGIWRPNGPPVRKEELESMAVHTQRFAPDGEWFRITGEIGFGVQAQYTHARSRLEVQPASDVVGNVLAYDGRLDNYRELMKELDLEGENTTDSEIILCAYRQLGQRCFEHLIGDWALTLWDARSHTLFLSRDHAGTRTLHYSSGTLGTVRWATYLDSYMDSGLLDATDAVYMASYLAMVPCYARSPYRDIQCVLPGHFLRITPAQTRATQFWAPAMSARSVRESPRDYKEGFLHFLKQSVARRTVPGARILAQLSGGMDSTSVVCVADLLQKQSSPASPTLDTLSYFDDSEPAWNERPYFTLMEAKRGRLGLHIDSSLYRSSLERSEQNRALYLYPGMDQSNIRHDIDLYSIASSGGYRSILSGIGGDEFTGGIPNPAGELAELIFTGRFVVGAQRALAWCLTERISLIELLAQSVSFLRSQLDTHNLEASLAKATWLTPSTCQYCQTALGETPLLFVRPFRSRPREAEFTETWWYTLRTEPHLKPSEIYRYEYRYPYLDRDFIEFLLRLPPEHLAQPGRRRSLMRATLKGIVPDEILDRRRKAYLFASPLNHVRQLAPRLAMLTRASILVDTGYIDKAKIDLMLNETVNGTTTRYWAFLLRFAALETWLQFREYTANNNAMSWQPLSASIQAGTVPAS